MSIRAEFQPTVDEFISDLTSFATGDYLQEDEKEFWDQPFDPQVLPSLKKILETFLDNLDQLPADPPGDALAKVAQVTVDALTELNAKHGDAVLEPEEMAELTTLFHDASAATGADDEALAELPEID